MSMKLMLLTNDCNFAAQAQDAGVDRIFLDLEYINKRERQRGKNTLISENKIEDVAKMRQVITKSEFLVRINPIHAHTNIEVERVVIDGADIIMLPMVMDSQDAKKLVSMVNGRARTCLLIETSQALVRMDEILEVDGVDEVYIGLNDMHISMGLDFMFELLSGGIVDYLAEKCISHNKPFGFGGIAKIGEGMLPAEFILGEHYRVNSSSVILSRTFRNELDSNSSIKTLDLRGEVNKIRAREQEISYWSREDYDKNRNVVKKKVEQIVLR